MNILLIGNPNVGKSVLFSRITGAKVIASNYAGTTVSVVRGRFSFLGMEGEVIDAPGIYTLTPTNKAEEVAVKLIDAADVIINVVDATNLERNLILTMELIEKTDKPLLIALNMWDETSHKGVQIDIVKLKEHIKTEAVATCGLTGEGVRELILKIQEAKHPFLHLDEEDTWCFIGTVLGNVQKLHHRHHTLFDILQEASIKPPWAYLIAGAAVLFSFELIRFIGEGMIRFVCDPLFRLYEPLIVRLSALLGGSGFIHSILIGHLQGGLDYTVAFGLLTTGLYVPLAMVLPYVLSFYFVLGLLEDFGYLPRLAVLADRLFHKIGLHGYAIVPMILGIGCNVPGALSTRLFEARREKFIAATLLAVAVPCMAQTSMIIAVLGHYGGQYVSIVFINLIIVWFLLGRVLNRFLKGKSPEILMEIPPYRRPSLRALARKLYLRVSWFFKEAVPFVLIGVLFVNILYYFKVIDMFAGVFSPVLKGVWGLPQEAISVLIMGFLRKDVAVGMLRPLHLSVRQLIVASTVLAVYFPCVATFMVLMRELGIKDMLKSILVMIITALIVGGTVNGVLLWAGMR